MTIFSILVGIFIPCVIMFAGLRRFRAASEKAIRQEAQQRYERLKAAYIEGLREGEQAARKYIYGQENEDAH